MALLHLQDISVHFSHKTCFEGFSAPVGDYDRIAIIGSNGSGKSTLLRIIAGQQSPSNGKIKIAKGLVRGYVPQIVENYEDISGGQRFNRALTEALILSPTLLILDEPTNHLDQRNRTNLMRLLKNYSGALIIASHDTELLRHCVEIFWHIDNGQIQSFRGNYDDYMNEIHKRREGIDSELKFLKSQKKDMHEKLMQEQRRASKSRLKGQKNIEQRKWSPVVGNAKASRAGETAGQKKSAIEKRTFELEDALNNTRFPEIITPTFSIETTPLKGRMVVQISEGAAGYAEAHFILNNINLTLFAGDRLAILGENGSGKSTLLKAILGDPHVIKKGIWNVVASENMGYLDQHYKTLNPYETVFENLKKHTPNWTDPEVRKHLNDFLFRKNEEVYTKVNTLSGGEKARLSLAQIAAKTPSLLVLDEITNNLDLQTKNHVVQILKNYPGSMIVVSHDKGFLEEVGVTENITLNIMPKH